MYWHIDTDIVSLIVIVAIYINRRGMQVEARTQQDRRFFLCMLMGICVTVIDIAASVIMDVPTNRFLYHVLMTLYFLSIEFVIVTWFIYAVAILYQQNEARGSIVTRIVLYVYAGYAMLAVTNPITGIFFTLDENMVYARGPGFFLMVLVFAIYTVALFTLIIVRRKHIPAGYPGSVLLLAPMILSLFIAVQLLMPGWLMILPGYMICLVLADLFLQDVRAKNNRALLQHLSKAALTDQMTGLHNRAGMEYHVQRSEISDYGKTCLVTVIDLDGLKRINDSMGHHAGDLAIQAVADALQRHFASRGTASRFGGDEFVTYSANDIDEALAYRSLRQLQETLSALCVGDTKFPISCSVGAVLGVVGRDSFETMCHRADVALYHVKRGGRNGYAFYKPEMEAESFSTEECVAAPVS